MSSSKSARSLRPAQSRSNARREAYRVAKRANCRRLFLETLESRQLLAVTAVIDIPGINGGSVVEGATSTDSNISGFNWGFRRESVSAPPEFSNLEIVKVIDTASPDLITQSLLGPVYAKPVVLRYLEGSDLITPGTEILKLEFSNAQLTSFAATNDIDEVATLSFGSLAMSESFAKDPATGKLLPGKRTASFNLLNGSAVGGSIVNPHPDPAATITDHTTLKIGGATLEIDSYEWHASTFINGRPEFSNLDITRVLDQATAGLLFAGVNGQTFPEITIEEREAFTDQSGKTVFRTTSEWKYFNAFISGFELQDDSVGDAPPENKLSFGYSKVGVRYNQFDANGIDLDRSLTWLYDLGTNKSDGLNDFGLEQLGLSANAEPVFDFDGDRNSEIGALAYHTLDWQLSRDPVDSKGRFGALSVDADLEASTPAILTLLSTSKVIGKLGVDTNQRQDRWELNKGFITGYRVKGTGRTAEPTMQFEVQFENATQDWNSQPDFDVTLSTGNFNQVTQKTSTPLNLGKAVIETPFELEITDSTGAKSEIPILNAGVNFEAMQGKGIPGRFEFASPRGIHSPGLFQATATGAPLPSANLVRYQTINGQRTEQYRWEITDTFLENYSTSLKEVPAHDREFFSLALEQSKVSVIYREVDKSSTKNYFAGWDFQENKKLAIPQGFVAGPLGLPLVDVEVSHAKFPTKAGSGTPELVGYRYGASLPVSSPESDGKRTVGEATSLGSSLLFREGPLPALFGALFDSKLNSVESLIGRTNQERQTSSISRFGEAELNGAYSYSDSIDFQNPTVGISFSGENKVTSKHSTKTSSPEVTWDLSDNKSTLTNGFGGFQFASGTEPLTVLEIPAQATIPGATEITELKIDSYDWFTSNPVFQPVGTKSAPVPLATREDIAQQVTFQLSADLTNAYPGLLYSLASGHKFPELKITQRRDVFLPNGTTSYLPYREWTLQDVYLTDLSQSTNDIAMSVAGSELLLSLSVGKVISKFFDYTPIGKSSRNTNPTSTFTNSVDYVSPPISSGIGEQQASSTSIRTIPLLNFFSDEQEPAAKLRYSYAILENESLFDAVEINNNKELVLDFANGLSGYATIRIDAMDAFGLIGSDTFQVAVDANGISDAPVGSNGTVSLDESRSHVFSEADFGFTDPHDVPANEFAAVLFSTLPAAGVLSLDDVPVTQGQVVSVTDINLGLLKFAPIGKENGTNYSAFTFQVQDDGGTANGGSDLDSSPNTISINVNPLPEVSNLVFGDGTAQRSMVRSITVDFDTTVNIDSAAFLLQRSDLGGPLVFSTPSAAQLSVNVALSSINGGTQTRATLTFTGSTVIGGSLPDGNYRLTINGSSVMATTGGLLLDGDGDGSGGDNYVRGEVPSDKFFRLFGDLNGDRSVGLAEFNAFRATFGKNQNDSGYNGAFDFNGDGGIGLADFNEFRRRFGLLF